MEGLAIGHEAAIALNSLIGDAVVGRPIAKISRSVALDQRAPRRQCKGDRP